MSPTNIYIIGAQSTGKTTLVHAIKDILDNDSDSYSRLPPPTIITEVARKVLVVHDFKTHEIRDSPERCFELQSLILKAQYIAEESVEGWIISDRSAVDPIVYAKQLVGEDAGKTLRQTPEWKTLCSKMKEALVVVCEAGVSWLVNDGVRLMPEDLFEWMRFHQTFCEVLEEEEIQYVVVSRQLLDLKDRARFVLDKWMERAGN